MVLGLEDMSFFLAENGYRAFGTDISDVGNSFTKTIAKKKKLKVDIKKTSDNLDYPDIYFDGIISFGVLYYLSNDQLNIVIPDLYRILKKGGKMLVIIRSKKDYRFNYAKPIGKGDYIIRSDNKTRVDSEKGMLMHFFTIGEIRKRFNMFNKLTIDKMINSYNSGKMIDIDYVLELEK